MNNPPFRTHAATDFVNAQGVRIRAFQMIAPNGTAYAIADYEGDMLTRWQCSKGYEVAGEAFRKDVEESLRFEAEERIKRDIA